LAPCASVRTLRRLGFAFWLTRARLGRRGGRFLFVGLGVAAAAAMLAAVIAGALAAEDRDVAKHVAAIDPGSRAVHVIWFGAVDGLGRWVRVRSGRLPRPCMPRRCEVFVVRGGGPIPDMPGLRLVPVGTGDVVSATLFGDAVPSLGLHQSEFVRQMTRYHRP